MTLIYLQIAIPAKAPQEQRLAFLLNVYHLLWLHSVVISCAQDGNWERWLHPASAQKTEQNRIKDLQEKFFYQIGGGQYNVVRLEKLLFAAKDKESTISATELALNSEPRIHFALNWTCQSCPAIQVYAVETVYEQLELATRGFLQELVQVEQTKVSMLLLSSTDPFLSR
jgi:hypothetical protein